MESTLKTHSPFLMSYRHKEFEMGVVLLDLWNDFVLTTLVGSMGHGWFGFR